MNMKHTPAPWKVERFLQHGQSFETYNIVAHGFRADALSEDNVTVAILPDIEGREFNAKLIAAAPELLEALQKAVEWIELGVLPNGSTKDLMLAAISKATT